jgi:hypothetical protein
MSVELVPLATARLTVGKSIAVGDIGAGTRLVVEIESAVVRLIDFGPGRSASASACPRISR